MNKYSCNKHTSLITNTFRTDNDTYYLFLVKNPQSGNKIGYMPKKRNYGFIFTDKCSSSEKYIKTVAHEIAHGAFRLSHTFEDYPSLTKNSTQNLMDYANGLELHKYQWDYINNPEFMIAWAQDDSTGAMISSTGQYVDSYIKNIRCSKYRGESNYSDGSFNYIYGENKRDVWNFPDLLDEVKYGSIWMWTLCNSSEASESVDLTKIKQQENKVYVGNDNACQIIFDVKDDNSNESEALAQSLTTYITVPATTYNTQFNKLIVDISNKSTEIICDEILNMSSCMLEMLSAEWRFFFFEKIINQDDKLIDNEIYAINKLFITTKETDDAENLLSSLKDKSLDCQIIDKTKKTNPDKYELMVMALTKLYLTQTKNKILEYGKNVEAENFYIWQPLGNMEELSNMFYADPNLGSLWNAIQHTIYSYKVNYIENCRFECDVQASIGTMSGYSSPTSSYFYINPLETVSVYFANKNKQLGIEGYTVAMPGIFFAWLIEQGEKETNQAMKDIAIFVASCYFPATNLTKAIKAKGYFSLVWNSLLLTKEISDLLLSNENFRSSAVFLLGPKFIENYMKFSQLYDCTTIFKGFAGEEYKSAAVEILDQWNVISNEDKTKLSQDFPEIYNKLLSQIEKLQQETTQ